MWRYTALIIFLLSTVSTGIISAQSTGVNTMRYVYRIKIDDCKFDPTARRQTGFRVEGIAGVITALHGVADCKRISAVSDDGQEIFNDLSIRQVDIERDIALLSSSYLDKLPSEGVVESTLTEAEILKVKANFRIAGYPLGLEKQDIDINIVIRDIESLDNVIPDDEEPANFIKRGSPDIGISVLNVQAQLLPGHSGAPLLDSNNGVIGIGDGGLRGGTVGRSWAIPWHDVHLQSVELTEVKEKLDELLAKDPSLALSFSSTYPTQPTVESVQHKLGGFVFDKATEDALRGAEVTLTLKDGYGYIIAYTDSKGAFSFILADDAASKLGELQVELPGYESTNYALINNKLPTEKIGLTSYIVPDPKVTELTKLCEIALIVFDARSRTFIENAQVTLVYRNTTKSDFTNSDGYFSGVFSCNETYPTVEIWIKFEGYSPIRKSIEFTGKVERIPLTPLIITPTLTPTPSVTPTPTLPRATATPAPKPPTPTEVPTPANVTVSYMSPQNLESIWKRTSFRDLTAPGIQTYDVNVYSTDKLRWAFEWCATDSARLQEILRPLSVDLLIDNIVVSETAIVEDDKTSSSGWKCHYWTVALTDWRRGSTVKLAISYSLTESINDGKETYPAGEYHQIIYADVN